MLATVFKEISISSEKKKKGILHQLYKFSGGEFNRDLSQAPLHIADIFDGAKGSYWTYQSLLMEAVNEHVPLKQKYRKQNMNGITFRDFWPTLKPFLSSKTGKNDCDVILIKNNTLLSDQTEVCNV